MTGTMLDATVIICAYTEKRWNELVAAVESIKKQSRPPCEIIVVIDHNKSLLEQAQAQIPDIILVENSEQQGLSGARNSGIAKAQGKLIAFLDDDATADLDWLAQLSSLCENPNVLGAGGTVKPLWLSKRPSWFPEEFFWVIGCTYRGQPEKLSVVRNPYGGCTCFRREVFEVIGGFRDGIGRVGTRPMGGEETELCIRAKQCWPQKVFLYEPQAKIHHCVTYNRTSWRYFCSRCYAEGLSKAVVAQHVGAKESLASERAYTLQTLPQGIIRGLMDSFFQFDFAGLLRVGAIIAGLMITTIGYLKGTIFQRFSFIQRG